VGEFAPNFTLYGAASVDSLEAPYYPLINQYMFSGRWVGLEITQKSRYVQICGGFFSNSYGYDEILDYNINEEVLLRTDITLFDFTRLVMEGIYGRQESLSSRNLDYLLAGVALKVDWEQLVSLRAELVGGWREINRSSNQIEIEELASEGILLHVGYYFTPRLETMIRYEWYDGDLGNSGASVQEYFRCRELTTLGIGYFIVPDRLIINGYYLHYVREPGNSWIYPFISWHINEEAILELQLSF
jgi:hypothetical protein